MNKKLKIKVCGMKFPDNREAVTKLPVYMLGFIFYPLSKRYIGDLPDNVLMQLFDTSKEKVGVFVDEKVDTVIASIHKFGLGAIQLHGYENPEYCQKLKSEGVKIIKAFRVNEAFDFNISSAYIDATDFFLFDTKAEQHGGTGKKFNWQILNNYHITKPFFLSGGIQLEDAEIIRQINLPMFFGVDLNSGFEDEPGWKNVQKLEAFIKKLNQ